MTSPVSIIHVFHLLVLILCSGCVENDDVTQPPPVDSCPYEDITGTCCDLVEADCTGICFGLGECNGCTDPDAINYDPNAITDDNNCVYDGFADSTLWQLVWNDEFNGSQIDPSRWGYDLGTGDWGWGNDEAQYYTNNSNNSFIQNGKLIIKAILQGAEYTSARMVTKNKGDWTYGRFDIRAKIPAGVGTWPAIWMLPTDWVYGTWPLSGEIDIMEHVGYDPNMIHGSAHTETYNFQNNGQKGGTTYVNSTNINFHNYILEWDEDYLKWYVDDVHYATFTNDQLGNYATWPFNQNFHLLLNIAIGGLWGGQHGIDNSIFPVQMEVDYVRVYENIN